MCYAASVVQRCWQQHKFILVSLPNHVLVSCRPSQTPIGKKPDGVRSDDLAGHGTVILFQSILQGIVRPHLAGKLFHQGVEVKRRRSLQTHTWICCSCMLCLNSLMQQFTMRCWKCCPPSPIHFRHLFRKCAFTWINLISEIQSISRLILVFIFSNAHGIRDFLSVGGLL